MVALLPTTLTTTDEYINFTSTHNFFSTILGLTSVSVTVTSVTVHVRNTSTLLIRVAGVPLNGATTGTFLGTGASITFSGYHFGNFDRERWLYRLTKADPTEYEVDSFTKLPETFYSLWNYTADTRQTTTISITVATSAGTFTLTQTLFNNWDVGRDHMLELVYESEVNQYAGRS